MIIIMKSLQLNFLFLAGDMIIRRKVCFIGRRELATFLILAFPLKGYHTPLSLGMG